MKNRNKALFFSTHGPGSQLKQAAHTSQTPGHSSSVAELLSNGFRFKAHWQQLIAQNHRKPERFYTTQIIQCEHEKEAVWALASVQGPWKVNPS